MQELREYGAAVGAKSKKKADLLEELRNMLPRDERWASSDSDWESVRLPGTNAYGNIDVREGVSDSLCHMHGLRLGPTAKAGHIPYVPALVGFSSYRGGYSPEISGIVIRKKDKIKLKALVAAKHAKKGRAEERRVE